MHGGRCVPVVPRHRSSLWEHTSITAATPHHRCGAGTDAVLADANNLLSPDIESVLLT